jgi:hypothetical protein
MKPSTFRRIWVFGDSFAACSIVGPHWSKFLAANYKVPKNTLNETNLGVPGSSLDFLYHEWNRTRHLITQDDLVVVCTTQYMRQWFSYPSTAHFSYKGVIDQHLYVDYYEKVYKEDLSAIRFQNFLDALAYWRSRKGIYNIVVLPCFSWKNRKTNITIAPDSGLIVGQGDLNTISENEVINIHSEQQGFFLTYHEPKQKFSHLTEENHKILADRIIHAIDNNEKTIDLTQGFVKDIYDAEELKKHPRNEPIPTVPLPNKGK